jgi:sugar lactone lactonase YvrE
MSQEAKRLKTRTTRLVQQVFCSVVVALLLVVPARAATIYVTNEQPNANSPSASSVSMYDMTGTFINDLLPTTPYVYPDAIVVDSALNVYVADASANRVVEFNSAGNQINVFNTDSAAGYSPAGLAIDPAGNVYVASLDGVIQKISGGTVTNIGTVPGTVRGLTYDPYNGLLYITTQYPGDVYTMPTSGGSATLFASNIGSDDLRGLAFGNGNLYVSDTNYDVADGAIYEFIGDSNTPTLFASNLQGPNYIAVDSSGQLLVAEYYGNDVLELSSDGTNLGSIVTGLDGPSGLALDPSGQQQQTTPEPAAWLLIALGGAFVVFGRAVRRRSLVDESRKPDRFRTIPPAIGFAEAQNDSNSNRT